MKNLPKTRAEAIKRLKGARNELLILNHPDKHKGSEQSQVNTKAILYLYDVLLEQLQDMDDEQPTTTKQETILCLRR